MNRKPTWVLLGLLILGGLSFALSYVSAQRAPRTEAARDGAPGRYQAIKVDGDKIILLDTATGDLYHATTADARPHGDRTKPHAGERPPLTGGAVPAKDRAGDPIDPPERTESKKDTTRDKGGSKKGDKDTEPARDKKSRD